MGVKRITIILMTMKPASLNRVTINPILDLRKMISSRTTTHTIWVGRTFSNHAFIFNHI